MNEMITELKTEMPSLTAAIPKPNETESAYTGDYLYYEIVLRGSAIQRCYMN